MYLDIFRKQLSLLTWSQEKTCDHRATFRTHSSIYDGALLLVKDFQPSTFFSQKSFIVDILLRSRYASGLCLKLGKTGDTELFFSIFEPILKPL